MLHPESCTPKNDVLIGTLKKTSSAGKTAAAAAMSNVPTDAAVMGGEEVAGAGGVKDKQ